MTTAHLLLPAGDRRLLVIPLLDGVDEDAGAVTVLIGDDITAEATYAGDRLSASLLIASPTADNTTLGVPVVVVPAGEYPVWAQLADHPAIRSEYLGQLVVS